MHYISLTSPSRSGKLKKASVDIKNVFVALAPSWTQSVARQQENRTFIYQTGHRTLDILPSALNQGKQFAKGYVQNMQNLAQGKFLYQEIFKNGNNLGRNTYSDSGDRYMSADLQPALNRTDCKSLEKCF